MPTFLKAIVLLILSAAVSCAPGARLTLDKAADAFPIPRAVPELLLLRPIALGFAAGGPVDPVLFTALTGPYAPLDLQVTRARDSEEASYLRNYYLGVTGRVVGVDVPSLAQRFHQPATVDGRMKFAATHLAEFKDLATRFRLAEGIRLVAQWEQPGDFRINDMFSIHGWVREAIASDTMGFVPSGRWNEFPSVTAFFDARGLRESAAMALVQSLVDTRAAAVVRLPGGTVQVLLAGIADNHAGILFQPEAAAIPQVGAALDDGTEFRLVEQLEPGVIYFETT